MIDLPLKISAYKTARSLKDLKTTWSPCRLNSRPVSSAPVRRSAAPQNPIAPERKFYHTSAIDFITGRAVSIERKHA